ncbi:MAG: cytidine deaminase [Chthoniobacterales bacterium]|nr:cytidine deaminase [Chthoniobacterales bacterium]
MDHSSLIRAAREVRENAYAPYSGFSVGAALLCEDGSVFSGCNVENLSFGLTQCAERVALGSAVAAGNRKIRCLAIIADSEEVLSPCGACRQVLAEFDPALTILAANLHGKVEEFSLGVLLPRAAKGILNKP